MNIPINQPHCSMMTIKFSSCATNPCVAAELWTRLDKAVHHEQPSREPVWAVHNEYRSRAADRAVDVSMRICVPTMPCATNSGAEHSSMPRARSSRPSRTGEPCIHAQIHPQSCPSHLEPSVLHTLRYKQCLLLLVIYLWGHFWPNYVGYLTIFVFLHFNTYLSF